MLSFVAMRAELDELEAAINRGEAIDSNRLKALGPTALHTAAVSRDCYPVPRLVRLMILAQEKSAAKELLEKTHAAVPEDAGIALMLANGLAEDGDHRRALSILMNYLARNPFNPRVLARAGELSFKIGDTEEGLRLYRLATANDRSCLAALIQALVSADHGDEALMEARQALESRSGGPALIFAVLTALWKFSQDKNEIASARDWLLKAAVSDPLPTLWRARIFQGEQQFERALIELDDAVKIDPNNPTLLKERAAVALGLGYWGRDAAALKEAVPAIKDNPYLKKQIARAGQLLNAFGTSLEDAARVHPRFAHVRTPESVFELVVNSLPKRRPPRSGTRLSMIASSLTAGGAERIVANMFRLLRKDSRFDWVKLYLFSLSPKTGTDFYLPLTGLSANEVCLLDRNAEVEEPFSLLPFSMGRTAQAIFNRLQQDRPAVVHASLEPLTLPAGLAALMAGVPRIVLHTHNMRPTSIYRDAVLPSRWRDCYGALLRRPEVSLVGVAQAAIDDYAEWIGLTDRANLHVVYNGLDFELFQPPGDTESVGRLRVQLGTAKDRPLVGTAFKFREEKRPFLWVDAACRVLDQRPDVQFVLFGDGPLLDRTRAYVEAKSLSDSIRLPGLMPDLHTWLPVLDLFMLCSISEALPNVLLEAQAVGVPVVAGHVGGVGETMIDGKTGILVKEDSAESLANAVMKSLADSAWRARASTAGRDFVRAKFNTETMMRNISEILLEPLPQ